MKLTTTNHVRLALTFGIAALSACGGNTSPIPDLPIGHLTVSTTPVDFGLSPCGATSSAAPVTLANDETSSPIHWTATVDGPFVLDGDASGTLASHTSTKLAVRAAVPSSAVAAVPVSGTLRIDSDDPSRPSVTVPLAATAQGAMLRFPAFPIEMGDVPVTAKSPVVAANLVNDGNLPVGLTFGVPSDPQFTVGSKGFALPPGKNGDVGLYFAPTTAGDASATAAIIADAPLCGAQGPLALHGKGTKGIALVSPGSLDYGLVDCQTAGGDKIVSVKNVGDLVFAVNASITSGTSYTLPVNLWSVTPGETAQIVVHSATLGESPVAPDYYAGTLEITTTAVGDVPHVIGIHQTARGAILSLVGAPLTTRALVDTVTSLPVSLYNSGNVTVSGAQVSSPDGILTLSPVTLAPGASAPATLEVRPLVQTLGVPQTSSSAALVDLAVPNCGAATLSVPVVSAYDRALDLSIQNGLRCVVGHTKRVYCSQNLASFSLASANTADEVSVGGGLWMRSGLSLSKSSNQTTTYYGLPSTWVKLVKPGDAPQWCATEVNGDLWCVGTNLGQWGNGQMFVDSSSPIGAFPSIRPVSDFAATGLVAFAVRNGEVWASGENMSGSLGNPGAMDGQHYLDPIQVPGLTDAVRVSAGREGGCAIRATGTVSCWGDGNPAQQPIAGISQAVGLVGDGPHAGCAVLGNGVVDCWNGPGPAQYAGISNPQRIVSNLYGGFCAIEAGNQVSCWQLGSQSQRVPGFDP